LIIVVGRPGRLGEEERAYAGAAAEIFESGQDFRGKILEEARVSVIRGLDEVEETDTRASSRIFPRKS
jgi:hypothetical protein